MVTFLDTDFGEEAFGIFVTLVLSGVNMLHCLSFSNVELTVITHFSL